MIEDLRIQEKRTEELLDRCEYELWLLEEIYNIRERLSGPSAPDYLIYPPDGGEPKPSLFGDGAIVTSNWRIGFHEVGSPLVVVTAFKALDMFIEWVIEQDGTDAKPRFADKGKQLDTSAFPRFVEGNSLLRERVVALYLELTEYRHEIIHRRGFSSSSGTLEFFDSSSKQGKSPVRFSTHEVRSLAVMIVMLLRCASESWTITSFVVKQLMWEMDELHRFHGQPKLGRKPPVKLNVRLHLPMSDEIRVDLVRIRADFHKSHPHEDVEFDLRVMLNDSRNGNRCAYLIPWDESYIERGALVLRVEECAAYRCPMPKAE